MMKRVLAFGVVAALAILLAGKSVRAQEQNAAPKKVKTPSEALLEVWNDIGGRLIAMAEDWPEDKYGFKPKPEVRSFADVFRHIAGSNYGLLNQVAGTKFPDAVDDPSPEKYKSKAQIVEFLKKSVADGAKVIKEKGDEGVMKALDYWIGYTEHMGEHYGQLVVYYRINGVVPPESRPKK